MISSQYRCFLVSDIDASWKTWKKVCGLCKEFFSIYMCKIPPLPQPGFSKTRERGWGKLKCGVPTSWNIKDNQVKRGRIWGGEGGFGHSTLMFYASPGGAYSRQHPPSDCVWPAWFPCPLPLCQGLSAWPTWCSSGGHLYAKHSPSAH